MFSPSDPNIIAGGCQNGQLVLWDISAHADRLKQPRGGNRNKKATVLVRVQDIIRIFMSLYIYLPGRVGQLVTCLATDVSLTADLEVLSLIRARSHTFVEIDHEIFSTVILLPSAESFKNGCCQLQAKVCAQSTG